MTQSLSIDMILCGNYNLNKDNNVVLFRAVHRYIHATKRFKTSGLLLSLQKVYSQKAGF